jgi:hypothetical protein
MEKKAKINGNGAVGKELMVLSIKDTNEGESLYKEY